MVSSLFRDVPDFDEEDLPAEDEADEESTDSDDASSKPAATSTSSAAPDADEDEDDGPVSRTKYESDMAAMQRMVEELKTSVGRAQSLARQVSNADNSAEVMTQLRSQNVAVAELFATLVDGMDTTVLDPALRSRIKEARNELVQAEQRAQLLDELRGELGIDPKVQQDRTEMEELQEEANELAAEIEDQIRAVGLDPADKSLFPWDDWGKLFLQDGRRGVLKAAAKAILAAQDADEEGTRREQRRSASGRTPRAGAPANAKDPLTTGDFESRYKALQAMTRG